ncbi:hypothetical protein RB599_003762 [Gaeumannomyces hyphopodioides]
MTDPPADSALGEVRAAGVFYKTYNLGPDNFTNYTWLSSNKTTDTPYHLYTMSSPAFNRGNRTESAWRPIPQLNVKDADITLVILRNEVLYQAPVQDPWFRASTVVSTSFSGLGDEHYAADQMPAFFIACAEKHRICSSNTSCTPFGGVSESTSTPASAGVDFFGNYDARATGVRLNRQQMAVHDLLRQDRFGSLQSFLNRGTRQLRALEFVTYRVGQVGLAEQRTLSDPPPWNQWQLEMAGMFNITVANMQVLASQLASPPDLPVTLADGGSVTFRRAELLKRPVEDETSATVCSRTRVRNLHHANFAFIPLVAVLAAGLAVILASLCCIPCVVFWPQKKLGRGQHRRREWQEGHLFMLQKAKLEAEGVGPWEVDEGGDIPGLKKKMDVLKGMEEKTYGVVQKVLKRQSLEVNKLEEPLKGQEDIKAQVEGEMREVKRQLELLTRLTRADVVQAVWDFMSQDPPPGRTAGRLPVVRPVRANQPAAPRTRKLAQAAKPQLDPADVLADVGFKPDLVPSDGRNIFRAAAARLSAQDDGLVAEMTNHVRPQALVEVPSGSVLFIEGGPNGRHEARGPISVATARVVAALARGREANPSLYALAYFCSEHRSARQGFGTGMALVITLLLQLIDQHRDFDPQLLGDCYNAVMDAPGQPSEYDVRGFCDLLQRYVLVLPGEATLFFVVEGIAFFEGPRERTEHIRIILSRLLELGDEGPSIQAYGEPQEHH